MDKKVKIIHITTVTSDGFSTLYALTSDGRILYRADSAWVEERIPDLNKPSKNGYYWIKDITDQINS